MVPTLMHVAEIAGPLHDSLGNSWNDVRVEEPLLQEIWDMGRECVRCGKTWPGQPEPPCQIIRTVIGPSGTPTAA